MGTRTENRIGMRTAWEEMGTVWDTIKVEWKWEVRWNKKIKELANRMGMESEMK